MAFPRFPRWLRRWAARTVLFGAAACSATPPPDVKAPTRAERAPKPRARRLSPLPAADVAYALRGSEDAFRDCFGETNQGVRGFVRLSWQIAPSGAVERVRVGRSSIDEPAVARCLSERVRALSFGRPERVSAARWAFVFRLEDAAPPPSTKPAATKPPRRSKKKKKKQESELDAEPGLEVERSSPGWLEPDAIENVVEAGYRLFARCYRDGIARNSALGGAIRLRFVIEEDGSVAAVWNSGSDLADQAVIDCVAEGFFAMQFPRPERGRVHVRYRLRVDSG